MKNLFFQSFNRKATVVLLFYWLLWYLVFTSRSLLSPVMPLIEDEFLISHARAGSLFATISVGNGISLFITGIFSGAIGYRRTILLVLFSTAVFLLSFALIKSLLPLYPILFFLGFSAGAYIPAMVTLLTKLYDEKLWGKVIPIHDSAAAASILTAPLLVNLFVGFLNWRDIFALLGVILLVMTPVFYASSFEIKVEKKIGAIFIDILKDKNLWFLNVVWIFAAGANMGLYLIMPLFLTKELMLEFSYANKILGIARGGALISSLAVSFVLTFFDLRTFLFWVLVISAILTCFISFSPVELLPYILFLQATIITAFFPSSFVLCSKLFDFEKRSFATGFTTSFGVMVGLGVISYALGLCGDLLNFKTGITLLGLALLASSFLLLRIKSY